MDRRTIAEATIDVCSRCKGLWVDWFDGELTQVAREAAPLSVASTAVEGVSSFGCPLCQRILVSEEHAPGAARVWRCGECAGSFVPRASFDALVLAGDTPEASIRPGPLARLLAALRALLESP
jgi:Zn-finger nucleic acid-binding protein